jgi:SAM-dependent methyltransferase
MLLNTSEVIELTELTGYRLVNHQIRKRLMLQMAKRHFAAASRLADIGCAAGDLTMELQALGFEMIGIDYEPRRIARARALADRRRLPVKFLTEDLRAADYAGSFDGMIMGEILEHFIQPRSVLEQHLAFLKSGGKILITVPNMASLRARLKLLFFGEFADHNPEHLYYFTQRRFREHFQPLSIDIVEMFTFLVELTLIRSAAWAKLERTFLSPLIWIARSCGSNIVAVIRKR